MDVELISRAAAIEAIKPLLYSGNCVSTLINMPAVDAAPVVHGRWEERRVDYLEETTIDAWQSAKCTNCGLYHTTPYMYSFTDYKFCPNCGAKMDGDA